jgi:hypothetical protein
MTASPIPRRLSPPWFPPSNRRDIGVTQLVVGCSRYARGFRRYDRAMSAPKCRDTDYIDFLIASPKVFTCTEAAAAQPPALDPPAHDAFTRFLQRLEPDPQTLWQEARPLVHRAAGVLVLDDSTLDKPYA